MLFLTFPKTGNKSNFYRFQQTDIESTNARILQREILPTIFICKYSILFHPFDVKQFIQAEVKCLPFDQDHQFDNNNLTYVHN